MNSPFDRQEMRKSKQPPSGAAPHALALMMIADAALASGHSIDAMVPVLRSALAAVPEYERNDTMLLSVDVMDMLVADVVAVLPPRGALNDDGSPAWHDDDNMNDDEAAAMGRFWYSVAAGEIVPATIFK